ncbi:MAG: DUF4129 domain-containing protein [Deltaproteobacteria bacterium]|nr:DUF4129 domain-containing protein [Deltaproteobacteria bacterium]
MDVRKGMLWYLVNGAMELSWFLGWAMFLSLVIMHRPFPFFETIAAFALAGYVTHFSTGKGWRIASVLGIEILGLICAALLVIHGIYYGSYPLLDGGWLAVFFDGSRGVLEWFILSLNLFLIIILWTGGVTLARRPKEYYSACNRFDLGLAAFFALFIIKLIALTKGELMAEDSLSLLFVFPFFLFGLLSIGMDRMRGTASKAFLPRYRGIGVIMSFVAVVLLGTGGLLLFFLPGLTAAAQMGYRALAVIGRPLVPVLIAVLRFVFGPRGNHPAEVATKSSSLADWDKIAPQTHGWLMELLEKVLGWGLWGLMLLALLIVSAVALFYTLKWLLSRTEGSGRQTQSIWSRFAALWAFLAGTCMKIFCGVRGYQKAAELYGALLGWAGRSGFPHDRSETPLEFGTRLNARFPALKPPIELIIGAYNREVYGEMVLGGAPLAAANSAWRFLRSPLRWPARFMGWLAGSSSKEEEM